METQVTDERIARVNNVGNVGSVQGTTNSVLSSLSKTARQANASSVNSSNTKQPVFRNRVVVNQNIHKQALEAKENNNSNGVQNTLQVANVDGIRTRRKNIRDELPDEYKSIWDSLLMVVDTNISLDNVILTPENQEKIRQFIKETEHREQLKSYGLEPMNRILMYGASGTGKTYLSKALSNHLGYTMLYIDIARALTDDSVAKNIADIFKLANYIKNCIIFFDECDAIAWSRDTNNNDTGTIRRATNSIFQYLDQMDSSNIFISCTNMLQRLDPAFERRFNLKMEFRRPSLDIDECIKHFLYPKFILKDDVSEDKREIIKRRVKQNIKLSYYEIEEIVKKAMKRSILGDTNIVKTSDLYDDFAFAMNIKLYFKADNEF